MLALYPTSTLLYKGLWIEPVHRGQGIGSALLQRAESEIAERGFGAARLRVVASNAAAISFCQQFGWQVERELPHETLPVVMLEMRKSLSAIDGLR
jgi:GNAT superfamily N-acetyltransferase